MVITSLHGIFTIVTSEMNQDQLLVKARNKQELMRIFDEKRIAESNNDQKEFSVQMCKQEFAHTLIMLIKEINYSDFEKNLLEIEGFSKEAFV